MDLAAHRSLPKALLELLVELSSMLEFSLLRPNDDKRVLILVLVEENNLGLDIRRLVLKNTSRRNVDGDSGSADLLGKERS